MSRENESKTSWFDIFMKWKYWIVIGAWIFGWLVIRLNIPYSRMETILTYLFVFSFGIATLGFIIILFDELLCSDDKKIFRILALVVSAVVVVVASNIISNEISKEHSVYHKGDFSEYECYECGQPADGGKVNAWEKRYYCSTHYEEYMEIIDDLEEREENQIKCPMCDKWFDKYSENGKNIRSTGYCISCAAKIIDIANTYN